MKKSIKYMVIGGVLGAIWGISNILFFYANLGVVNHPVLFLPMNSAFTLLRMLFCEVMFVGQQECGFYPMVLSLYLSPVWGALIFAILALIIVKLKNEK